MCFGLLLVLENCGIFNKLSPVWNSGVASVHFSHIIQCLDCLFSISINKIPPWRLRTEKSSEKGNIAKTSSNQIDSEPIFLYERYVDAKNRHRDRVKNIDICISLRSLGHGYALSEPHVAYAVLYLGKTHQSEAQCAHNQISTAQNSCLSN